MVLMALLGGKGTLWGPVIGAVLFHIIKEITWTCLLGWQWVALGLLIVITVVYFQQVIMRWLMEKYPHWFGIRVDGDKHRLSEMMGEEAKMNDSSIVVDNITKTFGGVVAKTGWPSDAASRQGYCPAGSADYWKFHVPW